MLYYSHSLPSQLESFGKFQSGEEANNQYITSEA